MTNTDLAINLVPIILSVVALVLTVIGFSEGSNGPDAEFDHAVGAGHAGSTMRKGMNALRYTH